MDLPEKQFPFGNCRDIIRLAAESQDFSKVRCLNLLESRRREAELFILSFLWSGRNVAEVCRENKISASTYLERKSMFGGMGPEHELVPPVRGRQGEDRGVQRGLQQLQTAQLAVRSDTGRGGGRLPQRAGFFHFRTVLKMGEDERNGKLYFKIARLTRSLRPYLV